MPVWRAGCFKSGGILVLQYCPLNLADAHGSNRWRPGCFGGCGCCVCCCVVRAEVSWSLALPRHLFAVSYHAAPQRALCNDALC